MNGTAHPDRWARWRFAAIVATLVILAFAAVEGAIVVSAAGAHPGETVGLDFRLYLDRARSWLAGDGFYVERQLTGQAYAISPGDTLYPPPILYLLVPFTVLPGVLWWALPLALLAVALYRLAPAWPAWPLLALALCYPRTWAVLVYGNPSMWVIAAISAGTVWRWRAVFALVKPTLAPLALIGARTRSWWIVLVGSIAISIPLWTAWSDYAVALTRAVNPYAVDYLLGEWPIAIAPLVAWLASSSSSAGPAMIRRAMPRSITQTFAAGDQRP